MADSDIKENKQQIVFEGIELGLMSETAKIKFMEGPLRFEILPHLKYKAVIEVCRGLFKFFKLFFLFYEILIFTKIKL